MSIEEAGRACRYSFLSRVAEAVGATHVAVGHTRDDQAETVLLHMLRGAGPRGLRAMRADRTLVPGNAETGGPIRLVRPLLDVTHGELVDWLRARSIDFREDESNADRHFLRNRVRHEVIPFLQERVSPSVSRVLARNASIAAADAECLDALASRAFQRLARVSDGRVEVDRRGVAEEPEAIARRVMLLALGNLPGARFVGFHQGERLMALARGRLAGPVSFPGATASVTGEALILTAREGRGPAAHVVAPEMNFWRCVLSIPGEAVVPGSGRRVVSSSIRPGCADDQLALEQGDGTEAVIDAGRVAALAVRHRRAGDWLRPLGLGGRKKLQDYFVDRKVPREERDRVPLVVDGHDRIVWVAGHGINDEFRVRASTRDVVILKLRGESA
jgi:tRNA(Ile)-lysidine synthase